MDAAITHTTAQDCFMRAAAEFVPAPDDNPQAVPFYRVWFGLRAAWGEDFVKANHHYVHGACCHASYQPLEKAYSVALAAIRDAGEKMEYPHRPQFYYCPTVPPQAPSESDIRAFFNIEFKRAFPGERANSKHANELWTEKRDKAREIMTERYQNALAEYNQADARKRAEDNARMGKWQAECDAIAATKRAIAELPD